MDHEEGHHHVDRHVDCSATRCATCCDADVQDNTVDCRELVIVLRHGGGQSSWEGGKEAQGAGVVGPVNPPGVPPSPLDATTSASVQPVTSIAAARMARAVIRRMSETYAEIPSGHRDRPASVVPLTVQGVEEAVLFARSTIIPIVERFLTTLASSQPDFALQGGTAATAGAVHAEWTHANHHVRDATDPHEDNVGGYRHGRAPPTALWQLQRHDIECQESHRRALISTQEMRLREGVAAAQGSHLVVRQHASSSSAALAHGERPPRVQPDDAVVKHDEEGGDATASSSRSADRTLPQMSPSAAAAFLLQVSVETSPDIRAKQTAAAIWTVLASGGWRHPPPPRDCAVGDGGGEATTSPLPLPATQWLDNVIRVDAALAGAAYRDGGEGAAIAGGADHHAPGRAAGHSHLAPSGVGGERPPRPPSARRASDDHAEAPSSGVRTPPPPCSVLGCTPVRSASSGVDSSTDDAPLEESAGHRSSSVTADGGGHPDDGGGATVAGELPPPAFRFDQMPPVGSQGGDDRSGEDPHRHHHASSSATPTAAAAGDATRRVSSTASVMGDAKTAAPRRVMSHRHIGGGQVREGAPGTARAFPSVPLLLRTIEHDVETPVDVPCRQHAEMSSTSEDTAAGCKPRPARGSTPPPAAVRPPHSVRIVIVVTQGYGALEVFQSVVVPEESARREAGRGETVPAKVVVEKAVSTRSGTAPPPKHDDAMVSLHPTVEPSGSVVGVGGSAVLPSLNWMSIRLGYLCGVAFCRATRRFRGLKHQKLPPSQPPPVESRPHAPEWSLLCHWGFEVLNERFSPVAFASNFDHHHCFPADAVGGEEPADGDRQTSGRVSTGVQFVSLVGGGACQKLDRPVDECRERTPRCSETVGDEADAGGLTPVPAADARLRSSTPDAALIRRRADRDEQHDALTDTAVESVEGRVFDVDRPRDAKSHPTPVDHEVPSTSRITTISTESEPPLHQSSSMVYTTSASLDESTAIAGTTKGATVRDKYAVVTDDAKDSNRPVEDDDQHTPREQTVRVTPSDEDGSGGAAQLLLTEQTSIDFHCSTDRAPLDASGQRRADELQEDDTVTFFCEDANTSGGSVLRPPVGDDSKKHQRGASDLPPPADSSSSTTAEAAGGQHGGQEGTARRSSSSRCIAGCGGSRSAAERGGRGGWHPSSSWTFSVRERHSLANRSTRAKSL